MPTTTGLPGTQRVLAPGDAPREASPNAPIAVLVCHGMGQQVPFETLQLVAAALHDGDVTADPPAVVRQVRFGDDWVPRVETTVELENGTVDLHLYEAYWAPVTEGLIRGREVLAFLLGAGWDGLRYTARGVFERWMRNERARYALPLGIAAPLLAAVLVIALLTASYVALWGMLVLRLAADVAGWAPADRIAHAADQGVVGAFAVTLVLAFVGWFVSTPLARLRGASQELTPRSAPPTSTATHALRWLAILAASLVLVAATWGTIGHVTASESWSVPGRAHAPLLTRRLLRYGVPLGLLIALRIARRFLVQYVGDVTIYVSSHTVSRFAQARRDIQKIGRDLAHRVYGAVDAVGALAYRRILVVGHSLGSVVAYDMLDEMLNFAAVDDRLQAGERTAALVTFGSPLDKTAFLFRAQSDDQPIREALAATVQPLMDRVSRRDLRWINVRSVADWVAGRLDFYDLPEARDRVEDVIDPGGWEPASAHTQYWTRPTLARVLRESLTPFTVARPVSGNAAEYPPPPVPATPLPR